MIGSEVDFTFCHERVEKTKLYFFLTIFLKHQ